MVIYKTTNKINGKIYIGQDRFNNPKYLGSGLKLKRSIKKYGIENFDKSILEVCESKEILDEREKFWIAKYDSTNDAVGYNIANGGQGGEILNWKQKIDNGINQKISKSKLGKNLSDDHKHSISKFWNDNKKLEQKEHKQPNKVKIGEQNPFYGKSHIGDMYRFGKHRIGKTPTNAHKVKRLDTMEIFDSASDAAKNFENPNTARRAIVNVCKGLRESFQGIKYEFA